MHHRNFDDDANRPTVIPVRITRRPGMAVAAALLATVAVLAWSAIASAHDGGLGGGMMDGMGPGVGGPGHGFGRGVGGQITITAIDGNDLALETTDGWTRTVTVTSATTITKAGQTIAVGDLDVGDSVRFSQTANSDGSYTIDGILVVTPMVSGTVTEVGSGNFKLTARDGTTWTVTTNRSTAYHLGSSSSAPAGSASDVKDGSIVVVQGTSATDNAMTAVTVRIQQPRVAGQVTATSADTITITGRDGTTATIHVSPSTAYQVAGNDSASLADITVGMVVMAEGSQRSDGSIDATTVIGHSVPGGRGWWFGGDAVPRASPATTTSQG